MLSQSNSPLCPLSPCLSLFFSRIEQSLKSQWPACRQRPQSLYQQSFSHCMLGEVSSHACWLHQSGSLILLLLLFLSGSFYTFCQVQETLQKTKVVLKNPPAPSEWRHSDTKLTKCVQQGYFDRSKYISRVSISCTFNTPPSVNDAVQYLKCGQYHF